MKSLFAKFKCCQFKKINTKLRTFGFRTYRILKDALDDDDFMFIYTSFCFYSTACERFLLVTETLQDT